MVLRRGRIGRIPADILITKRVSWRRFLLENGMGRDGRRMVREPKEVASRRENSFSESGSRAASGPASSYYRIEIA